MRRLIPGSGGFSVEDDPDGVLGDFLGFALSPPEDGIPNEQKLLPGPDCVGWGDLLGVCRSFPRQVPAQVVLEREELLGLLREARKERDRCRHGE
jgi:hypothetical protein